MLDDLRRSASDEVQDFERDKDDFDDDSVAGSRQRKFLGMTAVERMFISIFLFLNVLILGIALLLVTNKIQL